MFHNFQFPRALVSEPMEVNTCRDILYDVILLEAAPPLPSQAGDAARKRSGRGEFLPMRWCSMVIGAT